MKKKEILSLLAVLVLCIGILPSSALGDIQNDITVSSSEDISDADSSNLTDVEAEDVEQSLDFDADETENESDVKEDDSSEGELGENEFQDGDEFSEEENSVSEDELSDEKDAFDGGELSDEEEPLKEEELSDEEEPVNEEELFEEEEELEEDDIMMLSDGVGDVLDGDYAYLTNVSMAPGINGGYTLTTGTSPWDTNDESGNDSGADNRILRTFDTASYTVDMTTKVREDAPYGIYQTGDLYFELVARGKEDEVQWETGSMGWLESKHGVYAVTAESYGGETYQVLRGHITLALSTDEGHEIGNATQELSIVLRALALQDKDIIAPEFTFFMAYNDVGLTEEQYLAWGTSGYEGPIITFEGKECTNTNESKESLSHGTEYQTVIAPEVVISAAQRYNLAIVNSTSSKTQQMGSYDFYTGNVLALNQNAGTKYGRLGSYGLVLQLVGKDASSGLRGVQVPKNGETLTISFNLDLSSTYTSGTTVYETGTTSKGADLTEYAPLIWSFDANHSGSSQQDDRAIPTNVKYADQVPYNKLNYTSDAQYYDSCYDGGSWSISENTDGTYTVDISVCMIDMDQLPYTYPGAGTSQSYKYYNPGTINYDPSDSSKNDFWEVQTACLSAGELWIVQPYYAGEKDSGDTYIAQMLGEGSFSVLVSDTVLQIKEGDEVIFDAGATQAITTDDSASQSMALVNEGTIDQHIAYLKYDYSAYNDSLTDGCFESAKDWILQGDKLTIETYVTNDQAEEGSTGVAYDVMIKFDDAFFEPESIFHSGYMNSETRTDLWAAKKDGSGWDHKGLSPDATGYDSEMINATPDDLIYFSSLTDLKDAGYTCVGVLVQYRGLMTEQQNHLHTYVKGTTKTTCETGQVYMVTPYCRAWSRDDLAEAMAEDFESGYYGDANGALSALMSMSLTEVKTVVNTYIPTKSGDGKNTLFYEDDSGNTSNYADCHWKNGDYRYPNTGAGGSSRTSGILNYEKCSYDENGCHERTSGNYWGDSCLVVDYKSGLTMKVVQPTTAGDGTEHSKSVFDMDTGQTVVDYEISTYLERDNGEPSSETVTYTEIEITVTIPNNLTYIFGSSYINGTYETNGEGKQGTVTGGVQLTENEETSFIYTIYTYNEEGEIESATDYTVSVLLTITETMDDEGNPTQTLTYTFTNVPVTVRDSKQFLENIYYSCEISSGAVSNETELDVTADISCICDAGVDPTMRADGEATVGITVTKTTAISLVKTADSSLVEATDDIGFTLQIGNNSVNDIRMVAVDNIPYRGDGSSTLVNEDCIVYVTEFSAYDVTATRDLSGFYFFYTTEEEYAGKTSADYPEGEYFVLNYGEEEEQVNPVCLTDWVEMNMSYSEDSSGHAVYSYTDFPTDEQIYAIVGVGTISGLDNIDMHITLRLSDPDSGDVIINSFTQQHATLTEDEDGNLVSVYYDMSDSARVRVVGRTVSGTVWLDEDMDGGIRTGFYNEEQLLAGVDVELQILEDGNWSTAQKLKTAAGESTDCRTTTDENGYYEFDYLPEGVFRVVVSGSGTPGTGDPVKPNALSSYSLNDHEVTAYEATGIADSVNSKVVRTDGMDIITGIALPSAAAISGDSYDVTNQNAGYTKEQQLDVSKTWLAADGETVTEGNGTTEITATVTTSQNSWAVKLNEANQWEDTIDGLWYYDGNGNPIVYTLNNNISVTENGLRKKYELKDIQLSGSAEDGFAVVIENDEVTTEVSGEKTWEDNDNQDGVRPSSITIVLLANGVEYDRKTVTADDKGNWNWSWEDLPLYDDSDEEIQYFIAEVTIDDYATVIDGYDVINTHAPEKTAINVEKLWRDSDDQDGERPDSITVKLLMNGEETGEELILSEDNGWQGNFNNLDKYYDNGEEIEYSVAEIEVGDYITRIIPIEDTSTIIISNVHPSATVDVSGEKTWDDNEDQDGIRPESVTVHLLRDDEEIDTVTVPDEDGNWSWAWQDLPQYHDHGYEYVYTVGEEEVEGYTSVITDYDILNVHVPETMEISGFKTWDDADDQDGKRPESIAVNLMTNGEISRTIMVTAKDSWAWSFTELPKYKDGGVEIQYSVTEDAVEDYSTEYNGSEMINSYTPGQTSLTVVKVWDDENNADGIRAASISVELLKNGDETGQTVTLTADNNWTGSFTELDEYTEGEVNTYTVRENGAEGYTAEISGDEISGYVITNSHIPEEVNNPGPGNRNHFFGNRTGSNLAFSGRIKTGDISGAKLYWIIALIALASVGIGSRVYDLRKRGNKK